MMHETQTARALRRKFIKLAKRAVKATQKANDLRTRVAGSIRIQEREPEDRTLLLLGEDLDAWRESLSTLSTLRKEVAKAQQRSNVADRRERRAKARLKRQRAKARLKLQREKERERARREKVRAKKTVEA